MDDASGRKASTYREPPALVTRSDSRAGEGRRCARTAHKERGPRCSGRRQSKQAGFPSRSLVKVDPQRLHDLHLVISSISRLEHLTLFELGIAKKIDFSFAGHKVCASRSSWKTAKWSSERSIPISNCMPGCSLTSYQMWRWYALNRPTRKAITECLFDYVSGYVQSASFLKDLLEPMCFVAIARIRSYFCDLLC